MKKILFRLFFLVFILASTSCNSSSSVASESDDTSKHSDDDDISDDNDKDDDSTDLTSSFLVDHGQLRIEVTRIIDKVELSALLLRRASFDGGWQTDELSQSGNMVRDKIKANNPHYIE